MLSIERKGRRATAAMVGRFGENRQHDARSIGNFLYALRASNGELTIYEPIDEYMGMTAKQFATDLAVLGEVDEIDLYINSPGGDVFDALAIHSLLSRHPATINVTIDGIAASAASYIAMAGDTVNIVESGRIMIHNAAGLVYGPADELRKVADVLESLSATIANIYASRSGQRQATFQQLMDKETWFDAEAAVKIKLADRIIPLSTRNSVAATLRRIEADDRRYGATPAAIAARLRY